MLMATFKVELKVDDSMSDTEMEKRSDALDEDEGMEDAILHAVTTFIRSHKAMKGVSVTVTEE